MPQTVAIALSGGVDSLVSAVLLKEQGYRVIGLHFITGFEPELQRLRMNSGSRSDLPGIEAQRRRHLTPMVEQFDIPVHIIDLRAEFKSLVIDYFTSTYQRGKTPNPCMVCNQSIKFDILLQEAFAHGAQRIATGHYARIERGPDDRLHLLKGMDRLKDQSYFLARLSHQQLSHAILPLGGHTKDQTRRMAEQRGLRPAAKQESQDICFIQNGSYGDFLERQQGFSPSPGIIENVEGRSVGKHRGLHHFTIGQRRGINCPAAEPYYVVALDVARNVLIVGSKTDLQTPSCHVNQINWINHPQATALDVMVRVRYRHREVPARLTLIDQTRAEVAFVEPQSAVTPGQGAVFYLGNEVLGGGWIE